MHPSKNVSQLVGWMQDMVVFQKLEQTSPVPDLVPPRGPTDHQPVKEKPFGNVVRLTCQNFTLRMPHPVDKGIAS